MAISCPPLTHERPLGGGWSPAPGPQGTHGGGGGRRAWALDADPLPPSPPPCLEIGWKAPDHSHQRWRKQVCLIWQRVQKCVFTPCVYTQYTWNFQENSIMDKNWHFLS